MTSITKSEAEKMWCPYAAGSYRTEMCRTTGCMAWVADNETAWWVSLDGKSEQLWGYDPSNTYGTRVVVRPREIPSGHCRLLRAAE